MSAVRFPMGCLAWSWKCLRPISSERRVQKADTRSREIDAISPAYLPSRAVGVAALPSFCGSPAHWHPLASQMLACSQLKSCRRPYAVLMLVAIHRFSAWAHPGPCRQALCVPTLDSPDCSKHSNLAEVFSLRSGSSFTPDSLVQVSPLPNLLWTYFPELSWTRHSAFCLEENGCKKTSRNS